MEKAERYLAHNETLTRKLEAKNFANKMIVRDREDFIRALGKANKAADKLEQGIQKYLDGDEPEYKPNVDCVHGTPHYKDCFECIDDYFAELLHGVR